MHKHVYKLLIIFTLLLAAFLRFYRFSALTWFWPDQALDLLVAKRLLINGIWPMVGSILSVPKFFTPPTYYYILTVCLWLGKTPEGAALYFILFDMVTMLLLYILARRLVDKWMGLIVMALYAVSVVMISHARSMWNIHPVQLFLIASLMLLDKAWEKRSAVLYALSVFFYAVASSIYPSPLLLLPFYVVHGVRFFRQIKHTTLTVSLLRSVSLIGISLCITALPLLWFEMHHGWPTYVALVSESFGLQSAGNMFYQFGMYVFGFFLTNLWFDVPNQLDFVYFVAVFAGLFIGVVLFVLFQNKIDIVRSKKVFTFISLPSLLVGFISLILYRDMLNTWWPWHRLYAFLPFFFLLFGYSIRFAFVYKRLWYSLLIVILVSLYMYANLLTGYRWLSRADTISDTQLARINSTYIYKAITERNIQRNEVTIFGLGPHLNWNLYIDPELYFLWDTFGWNVTFDKFGNNVRNDNEYPFKQYVVLVCRDFTSIDDISQICLSNFVRGFPNYHLFEKKTFSIRSAVFIFRKSDAVEIVK